MLIPMEKDDFDRVYDIIAKTFISDEIRCKEGHRSLFEDSAYNVLVNDEKNRSYGRLELWLIQIC